MLTRLLHRPREDAEDGELPDEGNSGWMGAERVFGWLNLATWHALCGDATAALADCNQAAAAAARLPQVAAVRPVMVTLSRVTSRSQ